MQKTCDWTTQAPLMKVFGASLPEWSSPKSKILMETSCLSTWVKLLMHFGFLMNPYDTNVPSLQILCWFFCSITFTEHQIWLRNLIKYLERFPQQKRKDPRRRWREVQEEGFGPTWIHEVQGEKQSWQTSDETEGEVSYLQTSGLKLTQSKLAVVVS